jgi:predicted RNA binding protein YcfA (HicA-like mRNA interferase family)
LKKGNIILTKRGKFLRKILQGTHDANIPFLELCNLLNNLGFEKHIRGSHHIYFKKGVEEILNLQPKGNNAKPYQVKQIRNMILKYKFAGGDDE